MPSIRGLEGIAVIAVPKTCFRCGDEFRTSGTDRICFTCRKPKPAEPRPLSRKLTFREKQIVSLVGKAKPNKEIAYTLRLSEGTIKQYLNRVFRKLGTNNRTELALWAMTNLNSVTQLAS